MLRYLDSDWQVQHRVCRLMLLSKSVTGEELARQLLTALSTELSIASSLVVAAMHDQAAVIMAGLRTVAIVYNHLLRCWVFEPYSRSCWAKNAFIDLRRIH